MAQLFQRLKHHDHHDRRAVGVGNDATGTVQGILGIALRHHKGHIVVHTESTGVVNHHGTILRDGLRKLLRGTCTGRGEGDIYILEVVVMLQQLHLDLFTLEGIFPAGTTLRAKQHQFIHREISLIKYAQELLPHGATCANNCYFHISPLS